VKAVWTVALVALLAGCGTAPQMVSGSSGNAQANGLFSSFKESQYTQAATVDQIGKFQNDEQANRVAAGKRYMATGSLGYSIGDMQLVDANDVTLNLTGTDGGYVYIHRENFILRSKAESFVDKVFGEVKGTSTIYFTVKTGNIHGRIHVDAIKRPDGKIVTL
jgi:hypothetical protein